MTEIRRHLPWLALAVVTGCGGEAPAPAADTLPMADTAQAGTQAQVTAQAPPAHPTDTDLGAAILAAAGTDIGDARYFDADVDLNADGSAERIVYLAGPMTCGSGGCPVFIFTPAAEGYRLVTQMSVVRPPVRVSPRSTSGWRDLVVGIGGGGLAAGDAELKFDGTGYPSNPTVAPATPVTNLEGTEILIPEFGSYTEGKPIAAPDAAQ